MARLQREDALARIVLGGEPLSVREAGELRRILERLVEDRSVRLIVLESAGADFCPGAERGIGHGPGDPAELLAALTAPVLAVLDGRVEAAGLELALAADIRIAGPAATFAIGALDGGRLPSWGGTQRLPRLAGRALATTMILLGRELDADAAFRCGLVQYLDQDPAARATKIGASLLELSPLALGYAKEAVNLGTEMAMEQGMRLEGDLNSLLAQSDDRAEGLRAFFEKRAPSFQGR